MELLKKVFSSVAIFVMILSMFSTFPPLFNTQASPDIISGKVQILQPTDGFVAIGSMDITFSITNTGDQVEFLKGDSQNMIALEVQCGDLGVLFWSTFYSGLILDSQQSITETVTYNIDLWNKYGDVIIRIVHWRERMVGEFGIHEIRGKFDRAISWEYVFKDAKRSTVLKISTDDKHFQFIAPDKDFGVTYDPKMKVLKNTVIIFHSDSEMLMQATVIGKNFCSAFVLDKQTGKIYWLISRAR